MRSFPVFFFLFAYYLNMFQSAAGFFFTKTKKSVGRPFIVQVKVVNLLYLLQDVRKSREKSKEKIQCKQ